MTTDHAGSCSVNAPSVPATELCFGVTVAFPGLLKEFSDGPVSVVTAPVVLSAALTVTDWTVAP